VDARLWVTAYAPRVKKQALFSRVKELFVQKLTHKKAGTMS
jgi:hypothetical protein